MCVVDEYRAQSNIDFEVLQMPFLFNQNKHFNQIINIIKKDQEQQYNKL